MRSEKFSFLWTLYCYALNSKLNQYLCFPFASLECIEWRKINKLKSIKLSIFFCFDLFFSAWKIKANFNECCRLMNSLIRYWRIWLNYDEFWNKYESFIKFRDWNEGNSFSLWVESKVLRIQVHSFLILLFLCFHYWKDFL